ncbi:MAG TPA: lysozyme inhibitor LprI family protein [Allosphingosinicella sp.]
MILSIALALAAAQQNPAEEYHCSDPQSQMEMNMCAGLDFEAADRELNIAYRSAIRSAQQADREYARIESAAGGDRSGEPGEEATLREAQRAWVGFRDAQCRMESFEARGGSMQTMLDSGCRATLTRARTAELRGPNPDCPGEPPQDEINRCLERQFSRVDAALNRQWQATLTARPAGAEQLRTAQRAWIAFRNAHCESAVPSVANVEIIESERLLCRTRMTEARTQELAGLAAMGE